MRIVNVDLSDQSSKLDSFQPRIGQVGDFRGTISAVAVESSAFPGVVGKSTNHRRPQMLGLDGRVHQEKLGPSKRKGHSQLFCSHSVSKLSTHYLRRPSSSRLIIESHRRITLRLASHSLKISFFPGIQSI